MANWDPAEARRYHERTKHSVGERARGRATARLAEPAQPFKEYAGVEPLPQRGDPPRPQVPALEALAAGGETYHFRTYSSAGALYPVEVYLACTDLPGLAAGLYHFHPLELALRPLRAGDLRGALAKAAAAPDLAQAAAVLPLTGILWRSAWKYGARAYRHLFWDAGMLANLLSLNWVSFQSSGRSWRAAIETRAVYARVGAGAIPEPSLNGPSTTSPPGATSWPRASTRSTSRSASRGCGHLRLCASPSSA